MFSRLIAFSLIIVTCLTCVTCNRSPGADGQIDGIASLTIVDGPEEAVYNSGIIRFKDGKSLDTGIYELDYIGTLATSRGPFLILSGRECLECDAGFEIFVCPVSDGKLDLRGLARHPHPGENFVEGELYYEARAFFGDCLTDGAPKIVWFETYYDKKSEHQSVYIISVNENGDIVPVTRDYPYGPVGDRSQ